MLENVRYVDAAGMDTLGDDDEAAESKATEAAAASVMLRVASRFTPTITSTPVSLTENEDGCVDECLLFVRYVCPCTHWPLRCVQCASGLGAWRHTHYSLQHR